MASKPNAARSHNTLLISGYAVLVIGFLIAGVFPALRNISSAKADIASYQQQLDARRSRARELENVKGQVELAKLDTQDFARLVPEHQDLGSFLALLYGQLDAAGMSDVSVRNLAPITLSHSQKLPIEVHGKGTYAQFHEFLTRLETLPRLSSVGKLTIDADTDMKGNVEVQVTLFIYSNKPS